MVTTKRSLWAVRLGYDNTFPVHVVGMTAEEALAKRRTAAVTEMKLPASPKRTDAEINTLLAVDWVERVHFIDIE